MNEKVLYYVGNSIDSSTKVKKGMIQTDHLPFVITSDDEKIILDHIISCEKSLLSAAGTIIKVKTEQFTVFLLVPRLFINKGNGFAIVNRKKTIQLYKQIKHQI